MDTPLIEIRDIVKTFGTTRALDGFSMTVERGTVAGFLGPNAPASPRRSACCSECCVPIPAPPVSSDSTRGPTRRDPPPTRVRAGDTNLWPTLTGGEIIDVLTRIRGGEARTRRRAELLERFELDPTKKARTYSKGNRQKVALVAALASDAELYLLDEPTSGLDPLMERSSPTRCEGSATAARPCCCPATSSPRSRSSATR